LGLEVIIDDRAGREEETRSFGERIIREGEEGSISNQEDFINGMIY